MAAGLKCCTGTLLPQRTVITIFCFFAFIIMYCMRFSLPIAIIEINNSKGLKHYKYLTYCPGKYHSLVNGTEFQTNWQEYEVGLFFAVYYLGYSVCQIPAGLLTTIYGGKFVLAAGITGSSLLHIALPSIITMDMFYFTLFFQFLTGIFQGNALGPIADLLVNWLPSSEFRWYIKIVTFGRIIGVILGLLIQGIAIIYQHKWSPPFYYLGIVGLIFSVLFVILCYNTPDNHPWISTNEREYIKKRLSTSIRVTSNLSTIPWRRIFSSTSIVALITAASQEFGNYTFLIYFPKYYAEVLHLNIYMVVLYSIIPKFVSLVFSLLRYWIMLIVDYYKWGPLTKVSKILFVIGSLLPSILFLSGTYIKCDSFIVAMFFSLGFGVTGFCRPAFRLSKVFDINKQFAPVIFSIVHTFASLVSVGLFTLVGFTAQSRSPMEWQLFTCVLFVFLNTTATLYFIWSSAEPTAISTDEYVNIEQERVTWEMETIKNASNLNFYEVDPKAKTNWP